jgi:hypothetical protein
MMYKLTDLNPMKRPMQFTVEDVDKMVTAYKYLVEKHPEIALYDYRASRHLLPLSKSRDISLEDYTEISEQVNS